MGGVIRPAEVDAAIEALARAGFLAPVAEAAELEAVAETGEQLMALVERRTTGEPLAWITGTTVFCGETVRVDPGVYVPRPQTAPMAEAAAAVLPEHGTAVDLCTGSGAIAVVLARRRPGARVIGTDLDPAAIACARSNGVEAFEGDLGAALPEALDGHVDVVTGVVPYVPTEAMHVLPRDVTAFEPTRALDGGEHGTVLLEQAARAAVALVRPGGRVFFELGGDQDVVMVPVLAALGFAEIRCGYDADHDLRSIAATFPHPDPPA